MLLVMLLYVLHVTALVTAHCCEEAGLVRLSVLSSTRTIVLYP